MKRSWNQSEIDRAVALYKSGKNYFEIGEALDRSYASVNVKLSRLRVTKGMEVPIVPPSPYPLWTDPLKSEGDAVILTDIEAPFQHSEFINRVIDLADAWNVRTLHLAGDLLHYDNLSAWGSEWVQDKEEMIGAFLDVIEQSLTSKKRSEVISLLDEKGLLNNGGLSGELKDARRVFRAFDAFDAVYVAIGNHDDRYLRAIDQALSPGELLHQIDKDKDGRWKIAPYYYTVIETEGGTFRAEHPRGAGKNAAIDLAVQYHAHIVMGHSHRWSVNRDPSGKFWAIQTGHCVDERRLAYVMQRSAKRDAHLLGATIIRGGYPFVLCEQSPFELLKRM